MKNAKKNEKWACKWHFPLYRDRKVSENMNINPTLLTNWVPAKATFPVLVQPKLDGVRCIATREGLFTRNGKRIVAAAHVERQLACFFTRAYPGAVLDGELVHTSGCQATVSAIMRRDECEALHLHVFDGALFPALFEDAFDDRFGRIASHFVVLFGIKDMPHVHVVETRHATCEADVRRAHAYWAAEGFEGAVIRDPEAPYCEGRTDKVQKLKVHQDSEFLCVAAAEGILTFELKDGRKFLAQGGASFDASPVGKLVTVRFNGLTDDGIPRHAVAVCIRAD